MQCPRCKTALSGELGACWRCGLKPKRGTNIATAPEWKATDRSWKAPEPPKARGTRLRWFLGINALLAIGVAAAVVISPFAYGYYTGDQQVSSFVRGSGPVVASSDGGFKIRFPENPTRRKAAVVDGLRFETIDAAVGEQHRFGVQWADLNGRDFDLTERSAPAALRGQTLSESRIRVNARDLRTVTIQSGESITRAAWFVEQGRVYIITNTSQDRKSSREFTTFLQSFELTRSQ